jgi:PAS domain S-box-containing protein
MSDTTRQPSRARAERGRLERGGHAQAGFLGQLLEAIPAPGFFKDAEQVYRGCNRAFAEFLGRPRAEIVDKTVFEVAPPDLAQVYFDQDQALLANPGVQVYEAEVQTAEGRRSVVIHKATYTDDSGRVAGLVGVILDITERREAERELRDALDQLEAQSQATELERRRLGLILERTADGVALVDTAGEITFTNPAIRRLVDDLGTERVPANLADLGELYEIRDADDRLLAPESSPLDPAFAGGIVSDLELHFRPRSGGQPRTVLVSALPVPDAEGNALQVVVTMRDITRRKEAEEAALENARLYEQQRTIATTLQQSLIHPLPAVAGLELGLVARTANEPELVGGDFSDVFLLRDGRVAVLIGDVIGKGVRAAGLTETVRSAVRAVADFEASPAAILGRTNELLQRYEPEEPLVTALLLVLDRGAASVHLASAGHPPPVHLGRGFCRLLDVPFGLPLGAFRRDYSTGRLTLAADDCLVLYTDGVTEARRGRELLGEKRLVAVVEGLRGCAAQAIADGVLAAVDAFVDRARDDLQVVALRLA